MPLKKLLFKPGVNKERTRYANEETWTDSDKVRFRQGLPEKIGGWQRISSTTFWGLCRSLWNWVTLGGLNLIGVGTHLKFYIEKGGVYHDITPIRVTTAAGDVTFAATNGSTTITVSDTAHGATLNDFVTYSGAVTLGGTVTADVLNAEFQVASIVNNDTYTIEVSTAANASDTGNGGASVVGAYQINTGAGVVAATTGWGAGGWGSGVWGTGTVSNLQLRLWSQNNFGEDLVFGFRESPLYYWDATNTVNTRAVLVSTLAGASDVPETQLVVFISDASRFVFAMGTNPIGSSTLDPMLIRWSDQEDVTNWTPAATNQAGSLRLSRGAYIIGACQARQEVLVWTTTSLYSLQFVGAPVVWGQQLVGDNVSLASQNAMAYANGAAYWMGVDRFYKYDGRVQPVRCDLRRFIFNDINLGELDQVFAGTNEGFHEVWWFYCTADSDTVDRYVVYNYAEDIWYHGNLARTAWMDSGLRAKPIAATYTKNLVNHEEGVDDNETGTTAAITAAISSGEFDLDDGHHFALVQRIMPDVTFDGSTAEAPTINLTLQPLNNSGSGVNNPTSEGGSAGGDVTRSVSAPVEEYTTQLDVRVRGRQMVLKLESTAEGVAWQMGAPRVDLRPSGRR